MLKLLANLLFGRRKKKRCSGVKPGVFSVMLAHKYLDFLEVAARANVTPYQASSALCSLHREGKLERVKGMPSVPSWDRGLIVNKFCWRYRLITKTEEATLC